MFPGLNEKKNCTFWIEKKKKHKYQHFLVKNKQKKQNKTQQQNKTKHTHPYLELFNCNFSPCHAE